MSVNLGFDLLELRGDQNLSYLINWRANKTYMIERNIQIKSLQAVGLMSKPCPDCLQVAAV